MFVLVMSVFFLDFFPVMTLFIRTQISPLNRNNPAPRHDWKCLKSIRNHPSVKSISHNFRNWKSLQQLYSSFEDFLITQHAPFMQMSKFSRLILHPFDPLMKITRIDFWWNWRRDRWMLELPPFIIVGLARGHVSDEHTYLENYYIITGIQPFE